MSPSGPRNPTLSVKALNKKLFFFRKRAIFFDKRNNICYDTHVTFIFYLFHMTTLQKGFYSLVGLATTTASTFAAIGFGGEKVDSKIKGSEQGADGAVQTLISNTMLFLGILGVCYGIWGGFQIVTAGGDEEKVKKGRTIIIQVVIGLVVIFLANSIVQLVLNSILKA